MRSTWLTLSRSFIALLGAGALVMAAGGLTSGESLRDPVFPTGLALGVFALAAAWVEADGAPRALLAWGGLVAPLMALAVIGDRPDDGECRRDPLRRGPGNRPSGRGRANGRGAHPRRTAGLT